MTPVDPTPGPDADPTGVHDLLAGLGGPRPMPDELVARIDASLAAQRRSGSTVVPLTGRRRRRPGAKGVLGLAAAAALVVGTGLVLQQPHEPGAALAGHDAASAEDAPAPYRLTISEHRYRRATMAADLAGVSDLGGDLSKHASESPSLGPLTTQIGATDCLHSLGHRDAQATRTDVATFDGEPGYLLVAETDDGPRAWAVRSGCSLIYPDAYDAG